MKKKTFVKFIIILMVALMCFSVLSTLLNL